MVALKADTASTKADTASTYFLYTTASKRFSGKPLGIGQSAHVRQQLISRIQAK